MTSLVRQGLNEIDENQPPQLLRGGNLERQQADEASGDSHRPPCLGSEKSYFSKESPAMGTNQPYVENFRYIVALLYCVKNNLKNDFLFFTSKNFSSIYFKFQSQSWSVDQRPCCFHWSLNEVENWKLKQMKLSTRSILFAAIAGVELLGLTIL